MNHIILKFKRFFIPALALIIILSTFAAVPLSSAKSGENKYYLGSAVNAGHDKGYSKNEKITKNDPHFGWTLGSFYVDGYTRVTHDENGDPVFLKTTSEDGADRVTLWFELYQDIDKLNGSDKLRISGDKNGYDEYFGIKKTNFGRGALIIRHTDYQNHAGEPVIYTDYLAANASKKAAISVELLEEGDYEVALNYEIAKGKAIRTYTDYRIFFRFSVRNGNCMVYPFDAVTGAELTNKAFTENGFYLDLANSRYLTIDIKKEVLTDSADGLTEDVRFNKPVRDGEKYTEEGIYRIIVRNTYTNESTTKTIYVGSNDVLKAYATTGMPIEEIINKKANGYVVGEDGRLLTASEAAEQQAAAVSVPETPEAKSDRTGLIKKGVIFALCSSFAVAAVIVVIMIAHHFKLKRGSGKGAYGNNGTGGGRA